MRRAAITYEGLPKSSGGAHRLRTLGFRAGHDALQSFVEAVSLDTRPSDLFVEILEGIDIPKRFSMPLFSELDAHFPKSGARKIASYIGHQWKLDVSSLAQIIERLEQAGPVPRTQYAGPSVVLHSAWNLLLFDSRTGRQFPYQTSEDYLGFDTDFGCYLGVSSIYARISEVTTAHVFLSLPFEDVTGDARRLAGEIQDQFPTRLSAKHWKIWRLTRRQDSYVGRKIAGLW